MIILRVIDKSSASMSMYSPMNDGRVLQLEDKVKLEKCDRGLMLIEPLSGKAHIFNKDGEYIGTETLHKGRK